MPEPKNAESSARKAQNSGPTQTEMALADIDDRLAALEDGNSLLRKDVDYILKIIETPKPETKDIPAAVGMQTANAMPEPLQSIPQKQEVEKKHTPKTTAPAQKETQTESAVQSIRIGEHPDKIRIVLDATKKLSYRYDLDNMEHLLIIELPDAQWKASNKQSFSKTHLIGAYSAQPYTNGDRGTRLIIQLKADSKIIKDITYAENGTHRIVFDLAKP